MFRKLRYMFTELYFEIRNFDTAMIPRRLLEVILFKKKDD